MESRVLLCDGEFPGGTADVGAWFDRHSGALFRPGISLRTGAGGVRAEDRRQPGVAASFCGASHKSRGRKVAHLSRARPAEPQAEGRTRDHHGQTVYVGTIAKDHLRSDADVLRVWI